MVSQVYSYSLFAGWVMLFIFGGCLLLARSPYKDVNNTYRLSRLVLGVALLLFGVQILLQWIFDFRSNARHLATALNITIFYLEGILFGMSFTSLLNRRYINHRQLRDDFSKWGICMVLLWTGTLFADGWLRAGIQIFSALFFFTDAIRITILFFRTYRKAVDKMANYYSEQTDRFVKWLYRSTYGIVFFGLTGAAVAFGPKWLITIQMLAGIAMFTYIFLSFMNYMINFETVEIAVEGQDNKDTETTTEETTSDPEPVAANKKEERIKRQPATDKEKEAKVEYTMGKSLNEALEKWTAKGGYHENGITVEKVANQLLTNRTYLSNFINTQFKCTFRDWINNLRIEESKNLLIEEANLSIEQVAHKVGFASDSHFGRVFSAHEGSSPAKWRKEHTRTA